ncbi:MAG: hydantoinase/oxoprolinase family protein, partial [Pseudomonadota bacterium]
FRAGSGLPARIPVIDLIEIGAGGGSLAGIDARGVVRVGPQSAGADPGPAAYGLGGTRATLTDANLVLGYLGADAFLGGEMPLDLGAAERALDKALCRPLSVERVRAAWGVHETINEDVARAFRNHASERGFDYRRSAMVAFGGSGPIHAMRVANKLRVPQVVFPGGAGVMSAIGMLASPLAFETLSSEAIPVETLTGATLDARFADLFRGAEDALHGAGIARDALRRRRLLDMRYRGQGHEIEVVLPDWLSGDALAAKLPDLFAEAYAATFSKAFIGRAIDIVAFKAEVEGPPPNVGKRLIPTTAQAPRAPHTRRAFVAANMDFADVPVLARTALRQGETVRGPALIEERESTCVLGSGDEATIDAYGNLVATTAVALEAAA